MSSTRTRRILKELANIRNDKEVNGMCSVGLANERNLNEWVATIFGQPGTAYHQGLFHLKISLPENYPISPPNVKFETKIYHPNINEQGNICLNILKEKIKDGWTPAHEIRAVIVAICSLMSHPNPDDPLVPEIGDEFKRNRSTFEATARAWTMQFASY